MYCSSVHFGVTGLIYGDHAKSSTTNGRMSTNPCVLLKLDEWCPITNGIHAYHANCFLNAQVVSN